jgi:hypothetical protein
MGVLAILGAAEELAVPVPDVVAVVSNFNRATVGGGGGIATVFGVVKGDALVLALFVLLGGVTVAATVIVVDDAVSGIGIGIAVTVGVVVAVGVVVVARGTLPRLPGVFFFFF